MGRTEDEEVDDQVAKSSFLSSGVIYIAAGVISTIVVIAVIIAVQFSGKEEEEVVPSIVEPVIVEVEDLDNVLTGSSYRLEPFVINLNGGSGILRIRVALIFYELELPTHLNSIIPKFRDIIIIEASSFSAEALIQSKNKLKLKEAIKERLNSDKSIGIEVVNVLFEEFTVL